MLVDSPYILKWLSRKQLYQATHQWHPISTGRKENSDMMMWPLGGTSTPFLSSRNIISSFAMAQNTSKAKYKHRCLISTKETDKDKFRKHNFLHIIFGLWSSKNISPNHNYELVFCILLSLVMYHSNITIRTGTYFFSFFFCHKYHLNAHSRNLFCSSLYKIVNIKHYV